MTITQRFTAHSRIFFIALAGLIILPAIAAAQLENPVKLVTGTISNSKTGEAADGGKLWVYHESKKEAISSSKINPKTGFFRVILDPSTTYRFRIEAPSYYGSDFVIVTPPGINYEEIEENFAVPPLPVDSLLFSGPMFVAGQKELIDPAVLKETADFMKAQPFVVAGVKMSSSSKKLDDMGEERKRELKNAFRDAGVSLTRFKWRVVTDGSLGADDVILVIDSVEPEEDF